MWEESVAEEVRFLAGTGILESEDWVWVGEEVGAQGGFGAVLNGGCGCGVGHGMRAGGLAARGGDSSGEPGVFCRREGHRM